MPDKEARLPNDCPRMPWKLIGAKPALRAKTRGAIRTRLMVGGLDTRLGYVHRIFFDYFLRKLERQKRRA